MRKLCAILFAGLLLLQGCAANPGETADGPKIEAPGYLPTVFAECSHDGSLSLEADIDGDGEKDSVSFKVVEEHTDSGDSQIYCTSRLTVLSGEKTAEIAYEIEYPVALAAADLVPGDDCMELIVSVDFASQDYCSYIYRLTGDSLVLVDSFWGKLEGAEQGVVTFQWYDHPFGTWDMQGNYVISALTGRLEQVGDFTVLRAPQEDNEPIDVFGDGSYVMYRYPTLRAPLEVYTADGIVTLPEGTWFYVTGCDMESYVSLVSGDGLECRINVRYDEANANLPMILDEMGGLHETDQFFYELNYAG